MTSQDQLEENAAGSLRDRVVDESYKGIPLGERLPIKEIAARGWNVSQGDLALPVLTLRESAIASNLRTMQAYCERSGVLFAPHGKTTMAPQLFARQIEQGAWGMTAATPTQVAVMRAHGISRIILANELPDAQSLRWVAREIARDPSFDFYCLVDNARTVLDMDDVLSSLDVDISLSVLLEVGVQEGRSGVRSIAEAVGVAEAVAGTKHLRLVGVEAYEGLVTAGASDADIAALNAFFARMRDTVHALAASSLFGIDTVIVTAGGSSYFDRVVAELTSWEDLQCEVRVVLRSGCYISHDAGKYEKLSPLAGRRAPGEQLALVNGLTAWATVLSRPETDLVILGIGKRDVAFDLTLPTPRTAYRRNGGVVDLRSAAETFKLMDQHAFIRLPATLELEPGDIVSLDLSHPCTAFDKYRLLPVIDDDNTVIDAVLTFF